jgi:CRISPR/Cas system-associated endonuclease Cas1
MAKLHGQAAVAGTLSADAASTIRDHLAQLQVAATIDDLRQAESQAAASYWAVVMIVYLIYPY